MELVAKKQGDLLLVKVLDDRVDAACAIQFKEKMRDLATRAPRRVVLDMSRVTFLDSSGLGAVMGKAMAASFLGGRVAIEEEAKDD